jgi:hypothetical protein
VELNIRTNQADFCASDFYTFQAALTRQLVRGMAGTINQARNPKDGMGPGNFSIPIKQCWLQSAGILNIEPKKFKATGVVQFWQELSVAEHSVNTPKLLNDLGA